MLREHSADISQVASNFTVIIPKLRRHCHGFPPYPSDSLVLMGWLYLKRHFPIIHVVRTHLSCQFHLAVDFPGLRRNGSSSQVINQGQDFLEQASRYGGFGQLESHIAAMVDDLSSDLYQLFPQRGQ